MPRVLLLLCLLCTVVGMALAQQPRTPAQQQQLILQQRRQQQQQQPLTPAQQQQQRLTPAQQQRQQQLILQQQLQQLQQQQRLTPAQQQQLIQLQQRLAALQIQQQLLQQQQLQQQQQQQQQGLQQQSANPNAPPGSFDRISENTPLLSIDDGQLARFLGNKASVDIMTDCFVNLDDCKSVQAGNLVSQIMKLGAGGNCGSCSPEQQASLKRKIDMFINIYEKDYPAQFVRMRHRILFLLPPQSPTVGSRN